MPGIIVHLYAPQPVSTAQPPGAAEVLPSVFDSIVIPPKDHHSEAPPSKRDWPSLKVTRPTRTDKPQNIPNTRSKKAKTIWSRLPATLFTQTDKPKIMPDRQAKKAKNGPATKPYLDFDS